MAEKYYGASAELQRRNQKGLKINMKVIGLIAGILAFLGLVSTGVYLIMNSGPGGSFTVLVARQQQLNVLIKESTERIQSQDLAAVNAEATALFASDYKTSLTFLRENLGIDKLPKDVVEAESNAEALAKVHEGFLLNKYDLYYRDVLREEIASTLALSRQLEAKGSRAMKELLANNISHLKNIDAKLADLMLF